MAIGPWGPDSTATYAEVGTAFSYPYRYVAAETVEWLALEEDDGFWHPPYRWVPADKSIPMPAVPVIKRVWIVITIGPRAPPVGSRGNIYF